MPFALLIAALILAVFQVGAAAVFYFWLRRQAELHWAAPDTSANRAAGRPADLEATVIMCVRGHDPFLAQTLQALARQQDVDFRILVVVDHHSDPAWQVVQQTRQELGLNEHQLELQVLRRPDPRRGLKCSALLQAIGSLPPLASEQSPVIVTIDSDAVPGPGWLKHLLEPLADPVIGATTSNQWFQPDSLHLGSWVRSVWHAGAIVPTAILANPWAGSFAIRQRDLLECGLVEAWKSSIIDDGPVRQCLARMGKRLHFVPQNLIYNREDCSVGFCFRYVARMLTWSRLFESTFWLTALHMLLLVAVHGVVAAGCLYVAAINGGWLLGWGSGTAAWPLWVTAAGLLWLGQALGYAIIGRAIAAVSNAAPLRIRGTVDNYVPQPPLGTWHAGSRLLARCGLVLAAVPVALAAYAYGCCFACWTRQVVWRNVAYRIDSGCQVQMLEYLPMAADSIKPTEHQHSI